MDTRLDISVSGRVQGVGFRWHTMRQARALGLVGWVCNLPDGTVRIVVEGPREAAEAMLEWARHGPDHAHVERCVERWQDVTGQYLDFTVTG